MHETTRRQTLPLLTALALAATLAVGTLAVGTLAGCTDGNKANEAKGDVREAGSAPANDGGAAGFAKSDAGGAASDTLRPNPADGSANGGVGTQPAVGPTGKPATNAVTTAAPAARHDSAARATKRP